jgi:hypothetical protein
LPEASSKPLDPLRTPLRRFERLCVVTGVSPHLPVFEIDDEHDSKYLALTVVVDTFDDPQAL